MNLQTGLRSNVGSVPDKSLFSDRGGLKGPPPLYLKGLMENLRPMERMPLIGHWSGSNNKESSICGTATGQNFWNVEMRTRLKMIWVANHVFFQSQYLQVISSNHYNPCSFLACRSCNCLSDLLSSNTGEKQPSNCSWLSKKHLNNCITSCSFYSRLSVGSILSGDH